MTNEEQEKQQALQEWANADESEQTAMMFDGLMNLLADAVANDDAKMIKSYARLVTEIYLNQGDD